MRHELLLLLALGACKAENKQLGSDLAATGVHLGPSPGWNGGEDDRLFAAAWDGEKLVAAGVSNDRGLILRFTPDGAIDVSFGEKGVVLEPDVERFESVAVDGRGRIVAAGVKKGRVLVARYGSNGRRDDSFQGKSSGFFEAAFGQENDDHLYALAIDGKDRVVGAGMAGIKGEKHRTLIARFTPDGALDTTFARRGFVAGGPEKEAWFEGDWDEFKGLAIGEEDRIYAGGWVSKLGYHEERSLLARYDPSGALEHHVFSSSTSRAGGTKECGFGVSLDDRGRVLLPGFSFAKGTSGSLGAIVARYKNDALDPSFGDNGVRFEPIGSITGREKEAFHSAESDAKSRIWAAGYSGHDVEQAIVARYTEDGRPDPSFQKAGFFVWSKAPKSGFYRVLVKGARAVAVGTSGGRTFAVRFEEDGAIR